MIDTGGDNWAGGGSRDNGPMISKWEQLALAPELLRSLAKFGCVFTFAIVIIFLSIP